MGEGLQTTCSSQTWVATVLSMSVCSVYFHSRFTTTSSTAAVNPLFNVHGRWIQHHSARGPSVSGVKHFTQNISKPACSELCGQTAACTFAVWKDVGTCTLKRKLKSLSMEAAHGTHVWLSSRLHASSLIQREHEGSARIKPYPVECSEGHIAQSRRVVWTYWDSYEIPDAVLAIVHSWQLYSPTWTIRLLNRYTFKCYLPDLPYLEPSIKYVPLFTDVLRLSLLARYGGVWLDATVLITESLDDIVGPAGFRAVIYPDYARIGNDFVESWFLADDPGSYLIRAWRDKLLDVITANNGTFKGVSSSSMYSPEIMQSYQKIVEMIGGEAIYWSEYLVVYVCFTWLYHNDARFRKHVDASQLFTADRVGYAAQHRYGWQMGAINRALNAPYGQHTYHTHLLKSKLIKLSSGNIHNMRMGTSSFFNEVTQALSLRLPGNASEWKTRWDVDLSKRWSFRLVMARYDENISWTDMYRGLRVIYDKGSDDTITQQGHVGPDEVVKLDNRGLECFAYLNYIIDHYDILPEFVAFTQGGLDPDSAWIRRNDFGPAMFVNMVKEARRDGCSKPMMADPTADEGDWTFAFNGTRVSDPTRFERYTKVSRRTSHTFGGWFKKAMHLGSDVRGPSSRQHFFYPTGMMVISRTNILSRSRAYYQAIIAQIDYATKPLECQYLERAWYYIFNCGSRFRSKPQLMV